MTDPERIETLRQEIERLKAVNAEQARKMEIVIAQRDELRRLLDPPRDILAGAKIEWPNFPKGYAVVKYDIDQPPMFPGDISPGVIPDANATAGHTSEPAP